MSFNITTDLMRYFGLTVDFHIENTTLAEYREFWESLTDEEKMYYRTVDLTTGLVPEQ